MSAVAAFGSWRAARQSAVVDQERLRDELRPKLELQIAPSAGGGKTAVMYVTLKGLENLPTPGRIQLEVKDITSAPLNKLLADYAQERFGVHTERFGVHVGPADIVDHIWGPWEFQGGLKSLPPTLISGVSKFADGISGLDSVRYRDGFQPINLFEKKL
jgi:hypothetical protein